MSSQNIQNMMKFRKQLESCFIELDIVPKNVVSKMADVGIALTKKKTPVNKAPNVIGGTLRKAWKKTKVHQVGNAVVSGYTNNVHYGLYVNNGHRIVTKGGVIVGYVDGERMLEKGINEARRQTQLLFRIEVAKAKRKSGF